MGGVGGIDGHVRVTRSRTFIRRNVVRYVVNAVSYTVNEDESLIRTDEDLRVQHPTVTSPDSFVAMTVWVLAFRTRFMHEKRCRQPRIRFMPQPDGWQEYTEHWS